MKSIINLVGIVLVIFGIAVLGYRGFTYTTQEKVAQIGNVQVTAENEKTVYFHPITGVLSVVAGVVLLIAGRRKN